MHTVEYGYIHLSCPNSKKMVENDDALKPTNALSPRDFLPPVTLLIYSSTYAGLLGQARDAICDIHRRRVRVMFVVPEFRKSLILMKIRNQPTSPFPPPPHFVSHPLVTRLELLRRASGGLNRVWGTEPRPQCEL